MTGSLTAIARTKASVPARRLFKAGLLKGRCLDYGCGRGKDADTFGMKKYDPTFYPKVPRGRFDTITCTYVLNVVEPGLWPRVLRSIQGLLAPGGRAYITVRRDVKASQPGRGVTQRLVGLNAEVVFENKSYCTYAIRGWQRVRDICELGPERVKAYASEYGVTEAQAKYWLSRRK